MLYYNMKFISVFLFLLSVFISGCNINSSGGDASNPKDEHVKTKDFHPFFIKDITPPPSVFFFTKAITSNDNYILFQGDTRNGEKVFIYKKEDNNASLKYLTNFANIDNDSIDSMAMEGDYIALGSKNSLNDKYDSHGSVTLYKIDVNDTVKQLFRFNANDSQDAWNRFGADVCMYKKYILVKTGNANYHQYVYLFKRNEQDTNVTMIAKLSIPQKYAAETIDFADYMAIENNQIVISSTQWDENNVFVYNIENNDTVSLMDTIHFPYNSRHGNAIAFKDGYLSITETAFDTVRFYKVLRDSVTQIAQRNICLDKIRESAVVTMDNNYTLVETNNGGNLAVSIYKIEGDNVIQKQDIVLDLPVSEYTSVFHQSKSDFFLGFAWHNNDRGEVYQFDINAKDALYVYKNPPKQFDIGEGNPFSYTFDIASPAGALNYTIGGIDQSYFQDENNTLTNSVVFDYEDPLDSDGDNNYTFSVTIKDPLDNQKTFDLSVIVHDKKFIKTEMQKIPFIVATTGLATDGNYTVTGFWGKNLVYLYKNIDGHTTKIAELKGNENDDSTFGWVVGIKHHYLAVSAPYAGNGYVNVYRIGDDNTVTLIKKIEESSEYKFGKVITFDNTNKLYIGSSSDSSLTKGDGKVLIYQVNDKNVTKLSEFNTLNATNTSAYKTKKIVVEEPYVVTLGNAIHINKIESNGSISEVATLDGSYRDVAFENNKIVTLDENNITLFEMDDNDTIHQLTSYDTQLKDRNRAKGFILKNNKIVLCLNTNAMVLQIKTDNTISFFDQLNKYENWDCSSIAINTQEDIFVTKETFNRDDNQMLFKYVKDTQ